MEYVGAGLLRHDPVLVRAGVQLPVSHAGQLDYALHGAPLGVLRPTLGGHAQLLFLAGVSPGAHAGDVGVPVLLIVLLVVVEPVE